MASTTHYGWTTPDDTALVKDGASAIRTLGSSVDSSMSKLKGGTTGKVLAKNSGTDMDFVWSDASVGDVTLNGVQTLTNKTLKSPKESVTVSATAATGTINFDLVTQAILYYTTSASGNFTLNFRGDGSSSLDSLMTTGQAISAVFLNTNGATPYYPTAFQIDGSAVTPKWSGGTAPAAGNASAIDSYSFTIIKTGSAAFTVLAGGAVKFA